jgi:hypothetical protein
MVNSRDEETNRRWLAVSLTAWAAISFLMLLRVYLVGSHIHPPGIAFNGVAICTPFAITYAGILSVLFVSLPFRVFLNLIRPERRRVRFWETLACVLAFLALAWGVISFVIFLSTART